LFISLLSDYKPSVTQTVSWVKHLEGLGKKMSKYFKRVKLNYHLRQPFFHKQALWSILL